MNEADNRVANCSRIQPMEGCRANISGAHSIKLRRKIPQSNYNYYCYLIQLACCSLLFILIFIASNSSCHLLIKENDDNDNNNNFENENTKPKFQVFNNQHSASGTETHKLLTKWLKLSRSIDYESALLSGSINGTKSNNNNNNNSNNTTNISQRSHPKQAAGSHQKLKFDYDLFTNTKSTPQIGQSQAQLQRENDRRLTGSKLPETSKSGLDLDHSSLQFDDDQPIEAARVSLRANQIERRMGDEYTLSRELIAPKFRHALDRYQAQSYTTLDSTLATTPPTPRPMGRVSAQLTRLSLFENSNQRRRDELTERHSSKRKSPLTINPILLTGDVRVRSDLIVLDSDNSTNIEPPIGALSRLESSKRSDNSQSMANNDDYATTSSLELTANELTRDELRELTHPPVRQISELRAQQIAPFGSSLDIKSNYSANSSPLPLSGDSTISAADYEDSRTANKQNGAKLRPQLLHSHSNLFADSATLDRDEDDTNDSTMQQSSRILSNRLGQDETGDDFDTSYNLELVDLIDDTNRTPSYTLRANDSTSPRRKPSSGMLYMPPVAAASTSGIRVTIGQGTESRDLVLNSRGLITAAKRNSTNKPYNASMLASQTSYSLSPIETNSITQTAASPPPPPTATTTTLNSNWDSSFNLPMITGSSKWQSSGRNRTQPQLISAQFSTPSTQQATTTTDSNWPTTLVHFNQSHLNDVNRFVYNVSDIRDNVSPDANRFSMQNQLNLSTSFQHNPPYKQHNLIGHSQPQPSIEANASNHTLSIDTSKLIGTNNSTVVGRPNNRTLASTRRPSISASNLTQKPNTYTSARPNSTNHHLPPPYDHSSASASLVGEPVNSPIVVHSNLTTNQHSPTQAPSNGATNKPSKIRNKIQSLIIGKILKQQAALAQNFNHTPATTQSPSLGSYPVVSPHPLLSSTVANNVANLLAHKLNSLVRPPQLFGSSNSNHMTSGFNSLFGIRVGASKSQAAAQTASNNIKVRQRLNPFGVSPAGPNINRRTTGVGSLLVSGFIYGLSMLPALMALTGVNPLNPMSYSQVAPAASSLVASRQSEATRKQKPRGNNRILSSVSSDLFGDSGSFAYLVPFLTAANAAAGSISSLADQADTSAGRQQQANLLKSLYAPPPTILDSPPAGTGSELNSLMSVEEQAASNEESESQPSNGNGLFHSSSRHSVVQSNPQLSSDYPGFIAQSQLASSPSQLWPNRVGAPNSWIRDNKLLADGLLLSHGQGQQIVSATVGSGDEQSMSKATKLDHSNQGKFGHKQTVDWFSGSPAAPMNHPMNERRVRKSTVSHSEPFVPISIASTATTTSAQLSGTTPIILGTHKHQDHRQRQQQPMTNNRIVESASSSLADFIGAERYNSNNNNNLATNRQMFPMANSLSIDSMNDETNNLIILGPYDTRSQVTGLPPQYADDSIVSRQRRTLTSIPPPTISFSSMTSSDDSDDRLVDMVMHPSSNFDQHTNNHHKPKQPSILLSSSSSSSSRHPANPSSNGGSQWRAVPVPVPAPTRQGIVLDDMDVGIQVVKPNKSLRKNHNFSRPNSGSNRKKSSKRTSISTKSNDKTKSNQANKRRKLTSNKKATTRPPISEAESELQMAHSMAMGSRILNEPLDVQ